MYRKRFTDNEDLPSHHLYIISFSRGVSRAISGKDVQVIEVENCNILTLNYLS